MPSNQLTVAIILSLILVTVALAYKVNSRSCPNCRRLGTNVETGRNLLDTQATRTVKKKERYWILQSPRRRFWEETIERVVNVEEVHYTCVRCNHNWSRIHKSKLPVRKTTRDLDPREWGFFDDSL